MALALGLPKLARTPSCSPLALGAGVSFCSEHGSDLMEVRERCWHTNAILSPDVAAPMTALAGPMVSSGVLWVCPRCSPLELDLDFKSKQAWAPSPCMVCPLGAQLSLAKFCSGEFIVIQRPGDLLGMLRCVPSCRMMGNWHSVSLNQIPPFRSTVGQNPPMLCASESMYSSIWKW